VTRPFVTALLQSHDSDHAAKADGTNGLRGRHLITPRED